MTGDRIKRLRTRLGLDQTKFAELLNLSTKGYISLLENNKRRAVGPLLALLDRLCAEKKIRK